MTTTTQLVDGLGGALGSHYEAATNRLYFVEDDGKISVLDLVRRLESVVFEGLGIMSPDTSLRLTDGTSEQGGDIRWRYTPKGGLELVGQGVSDLCHLGLVDYESLTDASLQSLTYVPEPFPADRIVDGAVFAVFNRNPTLDVDFDYAKVEVAAAGGELKVRWVAYRLQPRYHVLATGYEQPRDIAVTADGRSAYVTEATGNLLHVDLGYPKRFAARVVASRLAQPQQMALDEARGQAYVVEAGSPNRSGRLLRVDLTSGQSAVVAYGFSGATGLLVTADGRTAYVSQQTGEARAISRVTLATGHREDLRVTLGRAGMLAWSPAGESGILTTDLSTGELLLVDLAAAPVTKVPLTVLPPEPASVAVATPSTVLVCSRDAVVRVDLVASAFAGVESLLQGIGHVPATRITDGYATTPPGYFFRVTDAPFGGTLPIMLDHHQAFAMGARYYRVLVDGAVQTDPWNDELWVARLNRRVLTPAPLIGEFFALRSPGQDWYNHWLCYRLATAGRFGDDPHTIEVRIYRSPDPATEIVVDPANTLVVQIDNSWPRAVIRRIFHHDPSASPVKQPVETCGIVQGHSDRFTFDIEARDVAGHLAGWSLGALWGDNRSATIASGSYDPARVAAPRLWAGVDGEVPGPAAPWRAEVAGDETSIKCAHTFYLHVWDRVIDGYSPLHFSGYTRSITLLLAPPIV